MKSAVQAGCQKEQLLFSSGCYIILQGFLDVNQIHSIHCKSCPSKMILFLAEMTDISPPDRMNSPVVQVSFNTFLTRSHTKLSDFPLAKTRCVNEALLSRGKPHLKNPSKPSAQLFK